MIYVKANTGEVDINAAGVRSNEKQNAKISITQYTLTNNTDLLRNDIAVEFTGGIANKISLLDTMVKGLHMDVTEFVMASSVIIDQLGGE